MTRKLSLSFLSKLSTCISISILDIIIMQQQDEYFWLVSLQSEMFSELGATSGPEETPDQEESPGEEVTDAVLPRPAGQLVLWVVVAGGRRYPGPAPSLPSTHLLARRTDQAAGVQPVVIVRPQADLERQSVIEGVIARPQASP